MVEAFLFSFLNEYDNVKSIIRHLF